jgi:hypothetical protein
VKTGRDFVVGHVEIARLFLRIGEGMSLAGRLNPEDRAPELRARIAQGSPGRVARRLLPVARPRVAPHPQPAAARPGHPGLGARARLALRGGTRVVGPRLPADAVGIRLPRLLSARRGRALQGRQATCPARSRRGRDGQARRPPPAGG